MVFCDVLYELAPNRNDGRHEWMSGRVDTDEHGVFLSVIVLMMMLLTIRRMCVLFLGRACAD